MQHSLFAGTGSLRHPTERLAFWLTLLLAFPAAALIALVLHETIGLPQVALFIVIAMVYVTLARGRLLGSSVMIHARQYPRVFEIVKRTCAALEIPMPLIFVREDNYVPVVAMGFGEPYSLVLSTHWIEVFSDDELAFMIGRELGHIAAGHTRFLSMLSITGNENPIVAMIFGGWLRRCTYTCDKVGLLCCASLDAATRAMGVASFHEFGRQIDYTAFVEQREEIAHDSILRWGAWLGSEPYATMRIESLRNFMLTETFRSAQAWFARERNEEPPSLPSPGLVEVTTRDCAGWLRRFAAFAIDAVVVLAIIVSFGGRAIDVNPGSSANIDAPIVVTTTPDNPKSTSHGPHEVYRSPLLPAATPAPSPSAAGDEVPLGPVALSANGVAFRVGDREIPLNEETLTRPFQRLSFWFWFPVYILLLVATAGQTFGMMIAGLRVVTVDFRRPGIGRTIVRSLIVFLLWWLIIPMSIVWRRVLLQDRISGTRVVKTERVFARYASSN